MIAPNYTLNGETGAPSFETLATANFTMLGTIAYYEFQEQDWLRLSSWVQSVNNAGFVSLVDFWGDRHNFSSEVGMAERLAKMGVGLLALDEPISIYNLTQAQLRSGIDAILQANPGQHFLINEYRAGVVENAYAWTTNYTMVRIATDQYDDKSVMDVGIAQASEHGKKPAFWLIFAQGSRNFDCYVHLSEWLTYAGGKSADVFFWFLDSAGTWRNHWEAVASFLPREIQQPMTVTMGITSISLRRIWQFSE